MKIGLIGYGNMGSMIGNNILKLNLLLDDEKLIISNRHIEKISHLKEEYSEIQSKIELTDNNTEVAKKCEKIIISVETPQFKGIIEEILPYINQDTHIIYTCAGLDFKHIKTFYQGKLTLIIPTLASTVSGNPSIKSSQRRKGISLVKHNEKVSDEDKQFIEDLFNEFSYVKTIEEKKDNEILYNNENKSENEIEISTILTSCGPAFLAIIIKTLAEVASEKSNLSFNECEEMVSKTIFGTIQLKENGFTNEEIINKVATKKGITQEGIDYLDNTFDKIANNLINHLLNRYDEVKVDMNKEYL